MFLVILSVCILVFSNALVVREPRIVLLCPTAEPNDQCPGWLQHMVWLAVYIKETGFCFHCYQGTGLIPHYCKRSSILWNDQYLQTFSKPAAIVLACLGSPFNPTVGAEVPAGSHSSICYMCASA